MALLDRALGPLTRHPGAQSIHHSGAIWEAPPLEDAPFVEPVLTAPVRDVPFLEVLFLEVLFFGDDARFLAEPGLVAFVAEDFLGEVDTGALV